MRQTIPSTDGNFRIIYADGSSLDMARDLSTLVTSFRPSAPNPEITYDEAAGLNGLVRMGKTYGARTITAECEFFAVDGYDYAALRDELVAALYREEEYYIVNENSPGKRWRVEVSSGFDADRIGPYGSFTIPFVCATGFAESIVRTSENEFRFDSAKLQFSQGIPTEPLVYRFTTPSFRVYNAGNVTVDWRSQDAVLTFKGASSRLRIRNLTSGADWRYTGTSTANDTVRLERGCRALKNSLSIVAQTNLAAFTLAPGWNEIRIEGSSGRIETAFDFRFLYL